MNKINIKPLSANESYKGRKFATDKYKAYQKEMLYKLPNIKIPDGERLALHVIIGYSNKRADLDNSQKPLLDILQNKYCFNDNIIYRLLLEKVIVPKSEEFISFKFSEMSDYLF